MLDFVSQLKVEQLSDDNWKSFSPTPSPNGDVSKFNISSVAQQILTCAFHELQEEATTDNALKVMPLLQEAMRRHPHDKNNLRHTAVVYRIMGEKDKAIAI